MVKRMYYFDWDENKNKINITKHGISFDEASTVFFYECALYVTAIENQIR